MPRRHRRRIALAISFAMLAAQAPAAPAPSRPQVHTVLSLDAPLGPGDYVWDDDGAPAAPLHIVVDLARERLYAYRGGVEVGRAFIMAGEGGKPTPTGSFTVLQKDADHVSNLYGAPMPWMLRLTWDGISIHGAWVDPDYATHGCVGVPDAFARILFRHAAKGTPVLVTRNWLPAAYDD